MIKPKINELLVIDRPSGLIKLLCHIDGKICAIGKCLVNCDNCAVWVVDTSSIKKFKRFEDIDFLINTITFDGEYPLPKIGWFKKLKTTMYNKFITVKRYIGIK